METVYYTLTARGIVAEGELEQAAGGTRRVMLVRGKKETACRRAGNNVVDLAAWKARREEEARLEAGEPDWETGNRQMRDGAADAAPRRRERRNHAVLFAGELLATAAVIAVAAALLLEIAGLL